MATRVLPVRPGVPHQRFQVTLDGVPFGFALRWNERAPAWVLTLSDAQGTVLRAGIRACLGTLLLPPRRPDTLPAGELLLVDTAGTGVDAGLSDFGADARVRLVYLEAADVAEVASGG